MVAGLACGTGLLDVIDNEIPMPGNRGSLRQCSGTIPQLSVACGNRTFVPGTPDQPAIYLGMMSYRGSYQPRYHCSSESR